MFVLSNLNQKPKTVTSENNMLPNRSNSDLIAVVIKDVPSMGIDGKPTFVIGDTKKLHNVWYVLTIYTNEDTAKTNPGKILIHDSGNNGLAVILGPGSSFPNDETQPLGIPDDVAAELNR
jgi:hypothetical protein